MQSRTRALTANYIFLARDRTRQSRFADENKRTKVQSDSANIRHVRFMYMYLNPQMEPTIPEARIEPINATLNTLNGRRRTSSFISLPLEPLTANLAYGAT